MSDVETSETAEAPQAAETAEAAELATTTAGVLTAAEPAAGHDQPMLPGELKPHPSPAAYVIIAAILCVITAMEVALSYTSLPDGVLIALLLTMAVIKFGLVASWFMHLRTDAKVFRRFFLLGIIAALVLFTIATATLHIFSP